MKILLTLSFIILALHADIKNGIEVYKQNCASCHGTNMNGGMGKDFNIVSYTRKKEDIVKYIVSPERMYKEFGYSSNAMPTLPLTGEEIEDVSEYIDSLQPFKEWMKKS